MSANEKIQKQLVYEGFGFPVVLLNVPMIKVFGQWTPKVDYNKLARSLLKAIAMKETRLTGNEVRFARQFFELTLTKFGEQFDVSHPAVMKWEKSENEPTPMSWSTEKDLRLFILDKLGLAPTKLGQTYQDLSSKRPKPSTRRPKLDVIEVGAAA